MSLFLYISAVFVILIVLHVITLLYIFRKSKNETVSDEKIKKKPKKGKRISFEWVNPEPTKKVDPIESEIVISLSDLLNANTKKIKNSEPSKKRSVGKQKKPAKAKTTSKIKSKKKPRPKISKSKISKIKRLITVSIEDDLDEKLSEAGLSSVRINTIIKAVKKVTKSILSEIDYSRYVKKGKTDEEIASSIIKKISPKVAKAVKNAAKHR